MWDWISDTLSGLSNAPFLKPIISFALAVAGAVIAYLTSSEWWAIDVLLITLAVSLIIFAESFRGPAAAFGATISLMGIAQNWETMMGILDPTPYVCGIHRQQDETSSECVTRKLNEAIEKHAPGAPKLE